MIELYENVLSESYCNNLIEMFDAANSPTQRKMFDEIELAETELTVNLREIVKQVGNHYLEKYDPRQLTPKRFGIEGFRIKRYEPNVHSFPWHIDDANHSGIRWLAFLFYLNDSDAGTEFDNLTVESKRGNILVFPPMWMYPHQGQMPKQQPKYIMSTYYHYLR